MPKVEVFLVCPCWNAWCPQARHADMAVMLQMLASSALVLRIRCFKLLACLLASKGSQRAHPRRKCKQLFVLGGDGAHKGTLQLATAPWSNFLAKVADFEYVLD